MTESAAPTLEQEEKEAWRRLSHTPDGALIHRALRRVLESITPIADSGALLANEGRRSLASDLMRLMAEGIEARGRSDSIGTGGGNDPVLTRDAKPVRGRRAAGPGRRVNAGTVVPGWNDAPRD